MYFIYIYIYILFWCFTHLCHGGFLGFSQSNELSFSPEFPKHFSEIVYMYTEYWLVIIKRAVHYTKVSNL